MRLAVKELDPLLNKEQQVQRIDPSPAYFGLNQDVEGHGQAGIPQTGILGRAGALLTVVKRGPASCTEPRPRARTRLANRSLEFERREYLLLIEWT